MSAEGQGSRRLLPPERLQPRHALSAFANGRHPALDEWLRDRAAASEGLSARTYVVCTAASPDRVIAYHAISTAMVGRGALPSAKLRRAMPDQVPMLLIGRLAVDASFQGIGLGSDLLADAVRRCVAAAAHAGARGILTHAIDDAAAAFYRRHGFVPSPLGELVLMMPIETARMLCTPAGPSDI
ncbi:MAG: GNAT family N-acetyltransferase [Alphaproteobacteria bacterium]